LTIGNDINDVKKEMKGLDLVRRDWCDLSKEMGQRVLDEIMSGKPRQDVVSGIHSYLTHMGSQIKSGRISLEKFVITKCLSKDPDAYPDKKGLPHVQVALKLRQQNRKVSVGEYIRYVICKVRKQAGLSPVNSSAVHPSALRCVLRPGGAHADT
jgi:DNA polymerase alpha subunit A